MGFDLGGLLKTAGSSALSSALPGLSAGLAAIPGVGQILPVASLIPGVGDFVDNALGSILGSDSKPRLAEAGWSLGEGESFGNSFMEQITGRGRELALEVNTIAKGVIPDELARAIERKQGLPTGSIPSNGSYNGEPLELDGPGSLRGFLAGKLGVLFK